MDYFYKMNKLQSKEQLEVVNQHEFLAVNDSRSINLFNIFICENNQKSFTTDIKKVQQLIDRGIVYYILVKDNSAKARGCIEKYSDEFWEVSDIRTHKNYRNKGYGRAIVLFITNLILLEKRIPTCYTTEDNKPMQRIMDNSGFYLDIISEDIGKDYYSKFKYYNSNE